MLKDFASDITANLIDIVNGLPPLAARQRKIILAFSGGLDSSALLRVISNNGIREKFSVVAAHLNHNMQSESNRWAEHCRKVAENYDVSFVERVLCGQPKQGESREAWAREQRYRWFKDLVDAGDLLLTAHHQDDQLETFFLQLIRGAGPHGLGGIRELRPFGRGFLARPMLNISREDVRSFLASENIPYLEDPSNDSADFDRNYLRLDVLPQLRNRWPHIAASVSRASKIQQVLADGLDEQANAFLNLNFSDKGGVSRAAFLALPADFRFPVIRQWCLRTGVQLLERRHFNEIDKSVFAREPNATLSIEWKNATLRFFRGELYLFPREKPFDASLSFIWNLTDTLELPNGQLGVELSLGTGIDNKYQSSTAKVGYYQRTGERCHPSGRTHSQTLKKLFQEWRVPPWERDKVPIIWLNDRIAAVVPYCICRDFVTPPGKLGITPKIKRHHRT